MSVETEQRIESQESLELLESAAKYLNRCGYYVTSAGGITVEKQDGQRRLVIQFCGERPQ
jgi:hypothetical protein